jgi:hypothetical protein
MINIHRMGFRFVLKIVATVVLLLLAEIAMNIIATIQKLNAACFDFDRAACEAFLALPFRRFS